MHSHSGTIFSVDNQPSLRDLCKCLLPSLAPHWARFAIAVDLDSDGTILGIIEQKCRDDQEACCRMLFMKWLQQKKPTWGRVIECLREANCTQLAEDVEKQLVEKKESHDDVTDETTTNSQESGTSPQPGLACFCFLITVYISSIV